MAKKTEEAVESKAIAPLTIDFNREDLNLMRDKINEVIAEVTANRT